jgi:hypothetical protein
MLCKAGAISCSSRNSQSYDLVENTYTRAGVFELRKQDFAL